MKSTLFKYLYTTLSILILIIFSVSYYFTIKSFREYTMLTTKTNLENTLNAVKPDILRLCHNESLLQQKVSESGNLLNVRITVIDPSGKIKADSVKNPRDMDNHLNRPEILESLKKETGFSRRQSSSVNQEMIYLAQKQKSECAGFIRTSIYLPGLSDFINIYKQNIIFVAIILLVVALSGAFLLTSSIADPIEKLAQASNQIASGNFDVSIGKFKNHELSELAENFGTMAKEIKKLFQNISRQKEELSSIFEAVNDKLLIIGPDEVILSSNRSFEQLFEGRELVGMRYPKVITNKDLVSMIRKTQKKQKGVMEEIEINGKIYLCTSAHLADIQETVIVLRDISELKNLENIKRDLIANASHELRTPLTAIKGFLETLIEDENGPNRKYLEIIERHTDRLIHIVQDLLILSRLEDKNLPPDFQSVKLNSIVDDTVLMLGKKAAQKNLQLTVQKQEEINIMADRHHMTQLLLNLVDNAIKYTEKGSIQIITGIDETHAQITIIDTGIGIDRKHLGRLFERFYVVDSSRSRSQGGTGLGLSIVKHIVNKHNGTISIESALEKGTKISIRLPLNQTV